MVGSRLIPKAVHVIFYHFLLGKDFILQVDSVVHFTEFPYFIMIFTRFLYFIYFLLIVF